MPIDATLWILYPQPAGLFLPMSAVSLCFVRAGFRDFDVPAGVADFPPAAKGAKLPAFACAQRLRSQ
jgi:hypothetical protein